METCLSPALPWHPLCLPHTHLPLHTSLFACTSCLLPLSIFSVHYLGLFAPPRLRSCSCVSGHGLLSIANAHCALADRAATCAQKYRGRRNGVTGVDRTAPSGAQLWRRLKNRRAFLKAGSGRKSGSTTSGAANAAAVRGEVPAAWRLALTWHRAAAWHLSARKI